jgi:hypothetical protein
MSNQAISRGGGGAMGGHATPTFGHPSGGGGGGGAAVGGYPSNIGSGPPLSPNRGMQSVQNASAAVPSISQRPSFMRHGGDRRGMMGLGIG